MVKKFFRVILKILGALWISILSLGAIGVLFSESPTATRVVTTTIFAVLGSAGLIPFLFKKKKPPRSLSGNTAKQIQGNTTKIVDDAQHTAVTQSFREDNKQLWRQYELFEELGVEQYEIVATLDSDTSEICRKMDGKVFKMSDYEPGVTAPPFHPNCRTTAAPYFEDDIGERATRDPKTGKTHYVPSDMKYQEWKTADVDKTEKPRIAVSVEPKATNSGLVVDSGERCVKNDIIHAEAWDSATPAAANLASFNRSIPKCVLELMWFENGPLANYKNASGKIHYRYGRVDLFIDPTHLQEPSLINAAWPISDSPNSAEPLGYYPSYTRMTPAQRSKYLRWLCNVAQSIDIGYVFVFYYGLERHLLFGKFEQALKMILLLRQFHNNNSFLAYSGDAIFLASLYNQRLDVIEAIGLDKFSLNIQLAISAARDRRFSSDLLIRAHKLFSFENKRYIVGNSALFQTKLEYLLTDRYGTPYFEISDADFASMTGTFPLVLANYSIMPEKRIVDMPDIVSSKRVMQEVNVVLTETHEDVKKTLREQRKTLKQKTGQ